jgi:molybdopterin-guanine dinucleotide biosynthesis protein A
MKILGAMLAGGQARRFGADKALATLGGMTLIDRIAATIRPQVHDLIIVGREGGIADRPPDIGPLGGIAAALRYAEDYGFDGAVTVPCDTPVLPSDLVRRLTSIGSATFARGLPVIGYWPTALAPAIDAYLASADDHSIRSWARHINAAPVTLDDIANINTRADLVALSATFSG